MLNIGSHMTISKGYERAGRETATIGGNTFQFFTRNPRGAKARALDLDDIQKLDILCEEKGFISLVAHAPYTYNFASKNQEIWDLAKKLLRDDLDRLEHIKGCKYIVLHPGSHIKQGIDYGIDRIAKGLNDLLNGQENTMVLLEGMAGKGTEIGSKFEELKRIIEKISFSQSIGVCLDTCHLYSAGYDIVKDWEGVLYEFNNTVGMSKLKVLHLNDSMFGLGSHKDRHAKIGEGAIGLEAMIRVINHPALKDIPIILETPNEVDGYAKEIQLLKESLEK